MDRKEFLKLLGTSCVALAGAPLTFSGCAAVYSIHTEPRNNQITVAKKEFIQNTKNGQAPRDLILIRVATLAFPIAMYRKNDREYHALWMECTHQGCEVNAQPGYLVCPCHGSEFTDTGRVVEGPAETDLKKFNVTTDEENIYVHL
ncbi:MAG: Rieske (2Fe-2S) protein [Fulvivirga sp.]|nr:Rieske (2Fe-2S) protein [Fulvivirga sp.]